MKVHVWLRKKNDSSSEEFVDYLVNTHAKLVTEAYSRMTGYTVSTATRTIAGEGGAYDAVSELAWASRDDFRDDLKSGGERLSEDMGRFTDSWGLVLIDERRIK